jgi:hypothetical protein
MRVHLKGLNSKRKRLSDGAYKTYYYAWKGGPRLVGEPGSPEFIAAYSEAVSAKRRPPQGVMLSVLQRFQASDDFRSLSARYRADIVKHIRVIEREFGDFPLTALTDRRSRGMHRARRIFGRTVMRRRLCEPPLNVCGLLSCLLSGPVSARATCYA